MRKAIKILAIVFAVFLANTNGFGNDPSPSVTIRSTGSRTFALYLGNIKSDQVKILIRDTAGFVLYKKNIRKETYSKMYNLKNLPVGEYILELKDDFSSSRYKITLSDIELMVLDLGNLTTFTPFMRHRGNILDLMVFSPDLAKHEIKIYNQNNNVVYRAVVNKKINIAKQYDFSQLESGLYNVVVASRGQKYPYRVRIE